MRRRLTSAALLATACGANQPPAPTALPVTGAWSYVQQAAGESSRCMEGGQLQMTQRADQLVGSFAARGGCEDARQARDFVRSGDLIGGRVQGSAISFSLGECHYQGTLAGAPPDRGAGTLRCDADGVRFAETVAGNWELRRQ